MSEEQRSASTADLHKQQYLHASSILAVLNGALQYSRDHNQPVLQIPEKNQQVLQVNLGTLKRCIDQVLQDRSDPYKLGKERKRFGELAHTAQGWGRDDQQHFGGCWSDECEASIQKILQKGLLDWIDEQLDPQFLDTLASQLQEPAPDFSKQLQEMVDNASFPGLRNIKSEGDRKNQQRRLRNVTQTLRTQPGKACFQPFGYRKGRNPKFLGKSILTVDETQLNDRDLIQTGLKVIERDLHKRVDEEEAEDFLEGLRNSQSLEHVLQFLKTDGISRLRMTLSFHIMAALRHNALKKLQEERPSLERYIKKAVLLLELGQQLQHQKQGLGAEEIPWPGFPIQGVVPNQAPIAEFGKELMEIRFLDRCLPVWLNIDAQLHESEGGASEHEQEYVIRMCTTSVRANNEGPADEANTQSFRPSSLGNRLRDLQKIPAFIRQSEESDEKNRPDKVIEKCKRLIVLNFLVQDQYDADSIEEVAAHLQRIGHEIFAPRASREELAQSVEDSIWTLNARDERLRKEVGAPLLDWISKEKPTLKSPERVFSKRLGIRKSLIPRSLEDVSDERDPLDTKAKHFRIRMLDHLVISDGDSGQGDGQILSFPVRVHWVEQSLYQQGLVEEVPIVRNPEEAPQLLSFLWFPEQARQEGHLGRAVKLLQSTGTANLVALGLDEPMHFPSHQGHLFALSSFTQLLIESLVHHLGCRGAPLDFGGYHLHLHAQPHNEGQQGSGNKKISTDDASYLLSQACESAMEGRPHHHEGYIGNTLANPARDQQGRNNGLRLKEYQARNILNKFVRPAPVVIDQVAVPDAAPRALVFCSDRPVHKSNWIRENTPESERMLLTCEVALYEAEQGKGVLRDFGFFHDVVTNDSVYAAKPMLDRVINALREQRPDLQEIILVSRNFRAYRRNATDLLSSRIDHPKMLDALEESHDHEGELPIQVIPLKMDHQKAVRGSGSKNAGQAILYRNDQPDICNIIPGPMQHEGLVDTHTPILSLATLRTIQETDTKRQSGLVHYFHVRPNPAGLSERTKKRSGRLESDERLSQVLRDVLVARHYLDATEARHSKKQLFSPVLYPCSWMTPAKVEDRGEFKPPKSRQGVQYQYSLLAHNVKLRRLHQHARQLQQKFAVAQQAQQEGAHDEHA